MEETILIHNIIGHNVVQGLCYPIIDGPVCCIKMGGHVIGITIMTCSLDLLNDHFKTKASVHLARCDLDWENCIEVVTQEMRLEQWASKPLFQLFFILHSSQCLCGLMEVLKASDIKA